MLRIHTIQTGIVGIKSKQPHGEGHGGRRLMNTLRDKNWVQVPIYAWVIEHPEGVIVVDTGETARTAQKGYFPRWHPFMRQTADKFLVGPEDEIGPQLQKLGIVPGDVRWVVLTHLHTDHAGGLHHFPRAEILVSRKEYAAAHGLNGIVQGYLPYRWPRWFKPHLVDFTSEAVSLFPASFTLTKAQDVILLPTEGHSSGHLSVLVREEEHSVFLAGDTSYTEQLMLDQVVDGVSPDEKVAAQTLKCILAYVQANPTVYLPSHDPEARERLARRQVVRSSEAVGAIL